jgi:hypothetical protein
VDFSLLKTRHKAFADQQPAKIEELVGLSGIQYIVVTGIDVRLRSVYESASIESFETAGKRNSGRLFNL